MAIQFNNHKQNRNVAQREPVTRAVTMPVTRDVTQVVHPGETALRVERLEREVAELRKKVAALQAMVERFSTPIVDGSSSQSRAAYMREYRKRSKPQE